MTDQIKQLPSLVGSGTLISKWKSPTFGVA